MLLCVIGDFPASVQNLHIVVSHCMLAECCPDGESDPMMPYTQTIYSTGMPSYYKVKIIATKYCISMCNYIHL